MSNIYVNLPLPTDVRINFNFVPAPLPTKAARKVEETDAVRDVRRALQQWYYSEYC